MPLIVNPLRVPAFYDKLNAAGIDNPGVFILISGGSRPYKWDRKSAAGSQGATSTYRGWDVSSGIKGKFVFWEATQIDEFYDTYLPQLQYDANKQSPSPVDIFHPALNANGVTAIQVDDIGPLVDESGGKQMWSVTIEFSEFRPAAKKNATATPNAAQAAPAGAGETKPSVQDEIDREIEKELEMARRPLPV